MPTSRTITSAPVFAVQSVSNAVYEGFLQSYDQKLGMRSYGACVDLLVNYYYDTALAHFDLA